MLISMVAKTLIISGSRHHYSQKSSENLAAARPTQSFKELFGATNFGENLKQAAR